MELSKDFLMSTFITKPVGRLEDIFIKIAGEKLLEELD